MTNGDTSTNPAEYKPCKALKNYPVKYLTYTTFCLKNLSNHVDFHPEEKLPCKNTWYRDLKSTHIRNKRLLDLSYKIPKCCSDVYNVALDRLKLKKVQKYGLTRPVRTPTSNLELEKKIPCEPETEATKKAENVKTIIFPECYEVPESSSDEEEEEEEEDEHELCASGSVSECSGCSTIGGGIRRRRHKIEKKNWRDLLHVAAEELCKASVESELRKHKMGYNMTLKLKKVF